MIMGLSRKNVLVGIALVAVVSGLALGSGAFTQVEASRTVDLGVEGDSNALIAFSDGSGATGIIGSETDNDNSMITLQEDLLNENATTTFEDALEVTNNGDEDVELSVSGSPSMGALMILDSDGNSIADSGEEITVDDSPEFDIVINTTKSNTLPDSVTFTANSTSS